VSCFYVLLRVQLQASTLMKDQPIKNVLAEFYTAHNLGDDGGQSNPSVRIEFTKHFHMYFPNFDARRKAVLWHDMHHLATGYSAASILGESEIAAWEIAAGCSSYRAAYFIDLSAVMLGIFINPWKVLKAYARGKRTTSLYHDSISKEDALQHTVEEIRGLLNLDTFSRDTKPTFTDLISFLLLLVFGAFYSIFSIALLPFMACYSIYVALK
jgi:hypothetical protein